MPSTSVQRSREELHIQNVSNYVNESAGLRARRGGKNWVKITNSQSPEHKGIWNGKCEIFLKRCKMKEFLFKVSTYYYIAAENIDEAYDKLKSEIIDEWDQVEDVETLDEHEL